MSSSQNPARKKAHAPRRARPTTARGPRYGMALSALFHGMIFAAALFTFHRGFETPEDNHVVPVDLVTIAQQTNIAAQAPPVPEPQKMDTPPPALEPPPEPQLQELEPAPVPPMPQFKIAKGKPLPADKPAPTKKDMQQDFNALLNKLTAPDKAVKNVKAGPRVVQAVGAGNAMAADLADMLNNQIGRCWSPPVGAPNAEDLIVEFYLQLSPDGRVVQLVPLTVAQNSYVSAAIDAVKFAITQCAPYRLPIDRYSQWQEIRPLRFNPRRMMNQ